MKAKKAALLRDVLIGSAFMTMGALLPGSLLTSGFEAHIGGIAMGIGIGWVVKSFITNAAEDTNQTSSVGSTNRREGGVSPKH